VLFGHHRWPRISPVGADLKLIHAWIVNVRIARSLVCAVSRVLPCESTEDC
jgi:hypothetical protein